MAARRSRSKKRSAVSYTPEQPNPLVFFIDRSLGKKTIADALKREGAIILGITP